MKKNVISLTDDAKRRVEEILSNHHEAKGLRLGLKKGGCAGMEYDIQLVMEENPMDEKVVWENGTVYISAMDILFLLGTKIDFEETKFRSGFVFINPNQVSACGCGESIELKPQDKN